MSVSERLNFSQPACVFRLSLQHGKHPDDRRSGEGLFLTLMIFTFQT